MISFPTVPAPAGLPGAPAGAVPAAGVDPGLLAITSGAQFLDLLKELTASAAGQETGKAGAPPAPAAANAPAVPVVPVASIALSATSATDDDPSVAATGRKPALKKGDAPVPAAADAADNTTPAAAPIVVAPVIVPSVPSPPPAGPGVQAKAAPAQPVASSDLPAAIDPDASADAPVKTASDPNAPARPKFAVAPEGQPAPQDTAVAASTAPVTQDAPVPAAAGKASPQIAQADDATRSGAAKFTAAAAIRDNTSAPVGSTSIAQSASPDASAQKRDSNAGADRRSLDASSPRAAAPAPGSAPALQVALDVRSLLTTGAVTVSSPSLEGGAITVHDAADMPQQIVQAMKLQWNNGVGDARIKLQPEYLGELAITIRVDRGDVTATLQASTPQVRQWIEGHESMLRQMLSDRGLQLDKFVVTDERPPSSSDEDAQGREPQERQQSNRRRANNGATFEVTA